MVCVQFLKVYVALMFCRDFNAPVNGRPADSSAATIVANGLLLLSQQEITTLNRVKWAIAAIQVRCCTSARILAKLGADFEQDHSAVVEAFVAEPVIEWDGQQASEQLLDGNSLW